MTIILAQADPSALKAEFIKSIVIWDLVALGVFVGIATVVIMWLQYRLDNRSSVATKKVSVEGHVETSKTGKRFNSALAEERHQQITTQLDDHENRLRDIERSRVRNEQRFNKIWIVLTRIATRMNVNVPDEQEEDSVV